MLSIAPTILIPLLAFSTILLLLLVCISPGKGISNQELLMYWTTLFTYPSLHNSECNSSSNSLAVHKFCSSEKFLNIEIKLLLTGSCCCNSNKPLIKLSESSWSIKESLNSKYCNVSERIDLSSLKSAVLFMRNSLLLM